MIVIDKVGKKFKNNNAIHDLSLNIDTSKITGIAGPNGCGKSTLIKIINGLIVNYEGEIRYDKLSKKDISLVSEFLHLPKFYTVEETLKIFNLLKKGKDNQVDEIIEMFDLSDEKEKKISELSQGNSKRLNIAIALLGNPKFIIFDEPTNGLDPDGIILLRNLIKDLKASGKGVLIASHILSELDTICNEVILMKSGKLITHSEIDSLKNNYGSLENAYSELSK